MADFDGGGIVIDQYSGGLVTPAATAVATAATPAFPVNPTTNILQYAGFQPAFFMPSRRSIGGIVAQVTIDEQASDDVQITEHPVEQGAPIADHAFKRPSVVTIRAGWSRQYAWDLSAESGVYGLLLSWQAALLPFDVYTGKRHYTNMLIERLQVTTDQHTEFTLMATITCRQVIIVSTSTTSVSGPASSSSSAQSDPSQTGSEKNSGDQSSNQTGEFNPMTQNPSGQTFNPMTQNPAGTTPESNAVSNQIGANGAEAPNNPQVAPAADPNDFY